MKNYLPYIVGAVVLLIIGYVIYNEWRKKRIEEEKARLMASVSGYSPVSQSPVNISGIDKAVAQQLGQQVTIASTSLNTQAYGGLQMA